MDIRNYLIAENICGPSDLKYLALFQNIHGIILVTSRIPQSNSSRIDFGIRSCKVWTPEASRVRRMILSVNEYDKTSAGCCECQIQQHTPSTHHRVRAELVFSTCELHFVSPCLPVPTDWTSYDLPVLVFFLFLIFLHSWITFDSWGFIQVKKEFKNFAIFAYFISQTKNEFLFTTHAESVYLIAFCIWLMYRILWFPC